MMTATKPKTIRKSDLYAMAGDYGPDASFVANVILNWHKSPTRKLAGLVKLLGRGRDVRTAQFSLDVLMIDGERAEWESLEDVR